MFKLIDIILVTVVIVILCAVGLVYVVSKTVIEYLMGLPVVYRTLLGLSRTTYTDRELEIYKE